LARKNYSDIKKNFNHDRRKKFDRKKREERDKFDPNIYVRNGNVDQAIRALKKRLLKSDFHKELAKREYYEKPCEKRKRKKNIARKKVLKQTRDMILRGEAIPAFKSGNKHLKGKKYLNKYREQKRLLQSRDISRRIS
tara:strand:- start:93 stop:506 length:414 start_codon:yes stop_codon:yes gene_type:complete